MRVLLTGAVGFIGSHIGAALSAAGHDVVGLDSLHPAAHGPHRTPDGSFMFGDVRDPATVAGALRGVDAVVHQAAMVGMGVDLADLPEYVSCNDLGTAVLLAGMARSGVDRLVLASSMVVYGEGAYSCRRDGPVRPARREPAELHRGQFEPRCPTCGGLLEPGQVSEDARLEPRSVYAATKLAQEHLAGAWARESGGTAVALRYHNVYGPGMPRDTPYSGVAAIFRSSLERGEPAQVYEDGGQLRDFVQVTDVARANVAALTADLGPGPHAFNVSSGEPHTVGEMATALTDALDGPPPVVTHRFRASDVRHIVASPERARRELGFAASTSFHTGMKELASAALR